MTTKATQVTTCSRDERKVTIDKARSLLGANAQEFTDHQVQRTLDLFYRIANVGFDEYTKNKSLDTDRETSPP